jgi:hypothetical protein
MWWSKQKLEKRLHALAHRAIKGNHLRGVLQSDCSARKSRRCCLVVSPNLKGFPLH